MKIIIHIDLIVFALWAQNYIMIDNELRTVWGEEGNRQLPEFHTFENTFEVAPA